VLDVILDTLSVSISTTSNVIARESFVIFFGRLKNWKFSEFPNFV
jgi:hypothetical protein